MCKTPVGSGEAKDTLPPPETLSIGVTVGQCYLLKMSGLSTIVNVNIFEKELAALQWYFSIISIVFIVIIIFC